MTTLTGREFPLLTAVAELVIRDAFHADFIFRIWLQGSTKYLIVIVSTKLTWFERFRMLLRRNKEDKKKIAFIVPLTKRQHDIIQIPQESLLLQGKCSPIQSIWHCSYLFFVSFFMVSHYSIQAVTEPLCVIIVCLPLDLKIPIGFIHRDDCWGFGLYCWRMEIRKVRVGYFPSSTQFNIHSLLFWISIFLRATD